MDEGGDSIDIFDGLLQIFLGQSIVLIDYQYIFKIIFGPLVIMQQRLLVALRLAFQ